MINTLIKLFSQFCTVSTEQHTAHSQPAGGALAVCAITDDSSSMSAARLESTIWLKSAAQGGAPLNHIPKVLLVMADVIY